MYQTPTHLSGKLCTESINYCDKIERDEIGWACSTRGDEKRMQNIGQKTRKQETFGRLMRIWEDNIRMDLGNYGGICGLDSSGSG
jgi:hypothetical protein